MSHKDKIEITRFVSDVGNIYGQKMSVRRGKFHYYLVTDLDCSQDEAVRVYMIKYVDKILKGFSEAITTIATTSAADHLFDVCTSNDETLRS